jgi:plastocyanin
MRSRPRRRRTALAAAATLAAAVLLPAGVAGSHPGHGPVVIAISEFKYQPAAVNVVEGDFVFWDWQGPDTNHTVTADAGQKVAFDSDSGKSAGQVSHKAGDGFSFHFLRPGTYTFHCKVHSFMTGTVNVAALPDDLKPQPASTPHLTKVSVKTVRLARHHAGAAVRFTLNEAVSMRATVRRLSGSRPVGKTLKEIDFNGPPGANRRTLDLGRLKAGRYQLALVAVDASSGASTKPVRRTVVVR